MTELVRSKRPSGIIPIKAPTVLNIELVKSPFVTPIWLYIRTMPTGTITTDKTFKMLSKDPIITEFTFLLYLASALILEM